MSSLIKRFLAPPAVQAEEKIILSRILKFILWLILGANILFLTLDLSAGVTSGLGPLLALLGFLIALLWLVYRGYLTFPSLFVPLLMLALFTFLMSDEGLLNTAMMGYLVVVIMAGVLLGQWGTILFSLLSIGSAFGLYYAQSNGLTPAATTATPVAFGDAMSIAFNIVIGASLFYVPLGQLNRSLTRARQNEQALAVSNEELKTIQISLEEQIQTRTHGLEVVATLNENLGNILEVEPLLAELVTLVQQNFGYDHVQIFILDASGQQLVLTADSRVAEKSLPQGRPISVDTHSSAVSQAARRKEIVVLDDVPDQNKDTSDLSLPRIRSLMAVPIISEGQLIGVLELRSGNLAAFDESDIYLMRSLTNQVAVTIRNARQFADISETLTTAQEAQNRYLAQAWEKTTYQGQQREKLFVRPEAPPLPERATYQAKEQALKHQRPTLVDLDGANPNEKAIVAPVKLGSATIGTFQIHQTGDQKQSWSEQDLAFVEAVLDQMAQTAENLRLFDETRQQTAYERLIGEITQELRQVTTLEELTKVAGEALGNALGISHTVVNIGAIQKNERMSNEN